MWKFGARRRAGHLGDLDYFDREIVAKEYANDNDDNEDDDNVAVETECETSSNGHVQGGDSDHDNGGPAWDPEIQPLDISEEVIAMALANSKLAMWDMLAIQLRECRESALPHGRPATTPTTPTHSNDREPTPAPSTVWDPWPPSPQHPALLTAWPQLPQAPIPPPPSAYQLPWRMPEFIDLVNDDEQ
jgi:hypothetical protein